MTLSIGIIIISMAIFILIGLAFSTYRKPKPIDSSLIAQSLPVAGPKTVKEILDIELKNVPTGCMWNVEKVIKTYRKAGTKYVFDGSASTVYVSIALIVPDGPFKSFALPLEDDVYWLNNFRIALRNNIKICLTEYEDSCTREKRKKKHLEEDWEGVYREGMF